MSSRFASASSILLARTFAALRHRNYRLYFIAQSFSLTGNWMQSVAAGWLVLRLTNSPFLLGAIAAVETLPSLFLSLLAGGLADAFDKRRIAVVTQFFCALQATALGLLVVTHHATFWSVFWLALFAGVVSAFDLPTRQSLMYDLVGPDDLVNANALNSMVFNAARIFGPALAAVIIARAGEAANFFTNAASFTLVIFALLAMRLDARPRGAARPAFSMRQMADGISYVARHPVLSRLFLGLAVYSVFGFNYIMLMPVIARFVLHGDAHTLGLLLTSLGAGALVASLTLAGRAQSRLQTMLALAVCFPLTVIAFGLSTTPGAALATAALLGFTMVSAVVRFSVYLQAEAGDQMRGRVMGLYSTVLVGLSPIGALQAGALAEAFGAGPALAVGAVACVFAAGALLLTRPPAAELALRGDEA